ncbi:sperm axonemal maintenance protein CFAP97D1 [Triplophysa dalaica]|uniref:sperm axonemal maintenance protein CFAP97D1 n=1 Tax=Triplophysa dalaica TaxID=1582913 RepID=UPI0024DFE1DD|nr:sperm axonemal maintenance protein CFAP97D1 [Triplophysa dalaica]
MQHQAYQPILPSVNKYLQYKWDKSCYEMHRKKVKSAKPTIATTPPKTYNHLIVKLKKLQLEEERISRIKRENQMLLDKMSHIMQTTGGVDCKNEYVKKSLVEGKRQLELLHIAKENQKILQRLSTCRPHYNIQAWHNQWLENIEFMKNISSYPSQYTQGSFLPPIYADRHRTEVHDKVRKKNIRRLVHTDSADMMNEKEDSDKETKSEVKVTSEDEA